MGKVIKVDINTSCDRVAIIHYESKGGSPLEDHRMLLISWCSNPYFALKGREEEGPEEERRRPRTCHRLKAMTTVLGGRAPHWDAAVGVR